jgi:hypothetical protein
MGSPFAAAMRAADRIIDKVYAETVRVEPQAGGEYIVTDDPERNTYDVQMVVGMYPNTLQFKYLGKYDSDKPQTANDQIHIWYHADKLPADRALWPKEGDRLVMVERPTEHPVFIQRIEPDGVDRYMARCARTPAP